MKKWLLLLVISLLALIPVMPTQASVGNQVDTETYILSTNPVFYLPLWQKDGNLIASNDVYGTACTVSEAPWTLQGRSFDGIDDVITIPDAPSLQIATEITLEAWIKLTVSQWSPIVTKCVAWSQGYMLQVHSAGAFRLSHVDSLGNTNDIGLTTTFVLNTWYHVVATKSGVTCIFYRDGASLGSAVATATGFATGTRNLNIGLWSDQNTKFPGTIGEVRIYNRALTPYEIQNNYIQTKWRYQ